MLAEKIRTGIVTKLVDSEGPQVTIREALFLWALHLGNKFFESKEVGYLPPWYAVGRGMPKPKVLKN